MNKQVNAVLKLKNEFSGPINKATADLNKFNAKSNITQKDVDRLKRNLKADAFQALRRGAIAAATALVALGTVAVSLGKKTASYSAEVAKMSSAMGVSTDAYQEMNFAMIQGGTSMSKVRVGAKTLLKQMTQAKSGNESAAKAFKTLGVSVTGSSGKLRSQQSVMIETINALQGMKNGSEKSALAMQLFGRSGQEMQSVLKQAPGTFKKNMQEAKKLGLVLDSTGIKAGVKLQHSMATLKLSMQMVGVEMGAVVVPYMQQFCNFVLTHMPQISAVAKGISKVFKVLGQVISAALSHPKITGFLLIGATAGTVIFKIAKLIKAFKNVKKTLSGFGTSLLTCNPKVLLIALAIAGLTTVIILCVKHWKEIKKAVSKGVKAFMNAVDPCGILRSAIVGIAKAFYIVISAIQTAIGWLDKFVSKKKDSGIDSKGNVNIHALGSGHATGTSYFAGGYTGFSEGGRAESAILPSGTKIIPADKTKKDLSGGGGVNVSVTIQGNVIGDKDFANYVGNVVGNQLLAAMGNV